MITMAFIGLLQALFLPGLLACRIYSRHTNLAWADSLIIATPISLIINYGLVAALSALGLYNHAIILTLFVFELGFLLYFSITAPKINSGSVDAKSSIRQPQSTNHLIGDIFFVLSLSWLTCLLAADYLPLLNDDLSLYNFISGFFSKNGVLSVFFGWDSVVSWNRWAREWMQQSIPNSWGYPQSIPVLLSLVYKLSGTTNIQNIAKLVTTYFPFFGLFCFWRFGQLLPE